MKIFAIMYLRNIVAESIIPYLDCLLYCDELGVVAEPAFQALLLPLCPL